MRQITALLGLALLVSGCVAPAPAESARSMSVAVSTDRATHEALALLMEQGYVITMADGNLGRIDASLARWPIYRVEVRVTDAPSGASISLQGFRDGQALSPDVVEPLFIELQYRLRQAS